MGNQEQSRGMEQISRAVLEMQLVTQTVAGNAQEGASAGKKHNNHAADLRALVHGCGNGRRGIDQVCRTRAGERKHAGPGATTF
jgi:hypothetical protein